MNKVEGDGKPEAQLRPSFSAALPIYILRRIYRRMCMFLISWMHKPRARARIDAPMRLARRTFSDARIAILSSSLGRSIHPTLPPLSLNPVAPPRSSLASSHFYTNPWSFIRFSLPLSRCPFFPLTFHFFPLCVCFSSRSSSTSPHLFREIPPFLTCSLRDPLKSFSLCTARNSFSWITPSFWFASGVNFVLAWSYATLPAEPRLCAAV